MKRILGVIAAVLFISTVAQAEDMSFVTVLSSPLGSFSNLETANRATAGNVTFATRGSGAINFYGGKLSAAVTPLQINLTDNVSLRGNNITNMKVTNLELADKGTLKGYRLIANTVTLDAEASGVVHVEESERTLYNQNATVKVGKADSMCVNCENSISGDSIIGVAFDTAWTEPPVARLEWSNFFQKNPETGAANSTYKKQYLLTTSHSTETSGDEGGDDPTDPTVGACDRITTSNWESCCSSHTSCHSGCYRSCGGNVGPSTTTCQWKSISVSAGMCNVTNSGYGVTNGATCPSNQSGNVVCNSGHTQAWQCSCGLTNPAGSPIYYCASVDTCRTGCRGYAPSDIPISCQMSPTNQLGF